MLWVWEARGQDGWTVQVAATVSVSSFLSWGVIPRVFLKLLKSNKSTHTLMRGMHGPVMRI